MTYYELIDMLDNIVLDCGDGPELRNGAAADLYAVRMGQFYNKKQSFAVVKSVAKNLRSIADELDKAESGEIQWKV